MAELQNNPLGNLKGKMGNLVASNWRDINYLKAKPKKSTKERSENQVIALARFRMMQEFLVQIKQVVEIGFGNKYTGRSTTFNLAVKANKDATAGTYPEIEIDYPAISLSNGNLTSCADPKVVAEAGTTINISWKELGQVQQQQASDLTTIVVYDADKKVHAIYGGQTRSEYVAEITLPESFAGDQVHVWMFFSTASGDKNSKTSYLGSVTVLA